MNADKLVLGLAGLKLAIETTEVAGIVSVQHPTYLPHQSGFVSGLISLRGEPVTVVDVRKAFKLQDAGSGHMIVVVRDSKRTLGLDAGGAETSFLWAEELKKCIIGGDGGAFTKGTLTLDHDSYVLIDWRALFDEAARLLTTDETRV
ncbi:MAG: chemotaxis protein CheW [Deltaproteobacteria bacterium]|nr:chemotaxis protein CheW [Deltaproteobacteria bacterium]